VPRTEFTDGAVRFRLEEPWRCIVESSSWNWGGGRVSTSEFVIDPAKGRLPFTLDLADVDVAEITRVLFGDRVSGTGALSGRVPVVVRWAPRPGIMVGKGALEATGPGKVVVSDTELARRWADQAGDRGGTMAADLRRRLIASLADFDYTALSIETSTGVGGRPAGTLRIAGKGAGREGLALDLTIRFAVLPFEDDR
jgi:hypothetical protein